MLAVELAPATRAGVAQGEVAHREYRTALIICRDTEAPRLTRVSMSLVRSLEGQPFLPGGLAPNFVTPMRTARLRQTTGLLDDKEVFQGINIS